ncbi:hypothetical protein [Oceanobacillus neutriphilus]|uniref:DUF4303 domain-containing protein n=1 Tax=Oceanobacillus neutriphilus TaxID=531815 RepID=A0ABQ2NRT6_9BACI|nr:hypothetical protein [Oceanobacillus neutriphilus]GGP09034.1 hypothetical protein GCM10011346_11470 [Oceanobacillus neutriphilus]
MINMDSTLIIKKIERDLDEVAEQTETEIMQLFSSLLSYDLMTGVKYYVSHEFDPPWDFSGTLFRCQIDENFNLADYEKVEEFLEEYTGNTVATYSSHYGLFHETYREKYSDWFEEQYRNAHYDYFNKLGNEVLELLAVKIYNDDYMETNDMHDLIYELISDIEEFEDMSIIHANNLCSKISEMDFLLIYKLGESEAKERLLQEQVKREKTKDERDTFRKRWLLLEKKYRLAYQKPFPKK